MSRTCRHISEAVHSKPGQCRSRRNRSAPAPVVPRVENTDGIELRTAASGRHARELPDAADRFEAYVPVEALEPVACVREEKDKPVCLPPAPPCSHGRQRRLRSPCLGTARRSGRSRPERSARGRRARTRWQRVRRRAQRSTARPQLAGVGAAPRQAAGRPRRRPKEPAAFPRPRRSPPRLRSPRALGRYRQVDLRVFAASRHVTWTATRVNRSPLPAARPRDPERSPSDERDTGRPAGSRPPPRAPRHSRQPWMPATERFTERIVPRCIFA